MKELHFAIVGCGRIAVRHAEHISEKGILKAVCDIERHKALTLADLYQANAYASIELMLTSEREIDVVVICTPNGLHAEHTIKALKSGCHVLCEKPMATKVQDCNDMIKAATKANKRLMIVKQNRFNPAIQVVKKLLENKHLGKLYSVQVNCFWNRNPDYYANSWKGTLDLDGGTLYTQFSHFIDILYWMVGDVEKVEAFGGNFHHQNTIEFEDNGVVILKFYTGVIGTIHYTVNSYAKNMEGSLTIFGERGTVKVGGEYLNKLEYQSIDNYKIEKLPKSNNANYYGHYQGSMSNHDKVYENVIEVLNKNGIISANGFEGLKTIEIISRIYGKIKNRQQYI